MKAERIYEGTNFITGLRAVAVLLVFLIHSGGAGLAELGGFFNNFVMAGKYGVEIFFVISGFTIFCQFFEGDYTLRRFLLIRMSRISIPYFPILLIIFIYLKFGGTNFGWGTLYDPDGSYFINLLRHVTYTGMFDLRYANTMIGVEWTLNIEVFFYCILGYFITRKFLRVRFNILFVYLFIFTSIAIFFLILSHLNIINSSLVHVMPFKYGWMFVLGGCSYYLRKKWGKSLEPKFAEALSNISLISSFLLVICYLNLDSFDKLGPINEGFFALITFVLVTLVKDTSFFASILTNRYSIFLGSISYSFYLVHLLIITFNISSRIFGISNSTTAFFIHFFISICVAFVWYKISEQFIYSKVKIFINKRYK